MSYKSVTEQSTRSSTVYMIMPKTVMVIKPELRNERMSRALNVGALLPFDDSMSGRRLALFYYNLPTKGIALEEYSDYLVVNVGISSSEDRFPLVMDIASEKEKGLILKPPQNPAHLYVMDKLVLTHNDLYGFESIRF